MLFLHRLQLIHNDVPFAGDQLFAGAVLPQSVLVGEGGNHFIVVHQVGYDIAAFYIERVGMQVEAFTQFGDFKRYGLGALLRGMSATLGIEVEQGIAFYHYRHTGSYFTKRVNAQLLLC